MLLTCVTSAEVTQMITTAAIRNKPALYRQPITKENKADEEIQKYTQKSVWYNQISDFRLATDVGLDWLVRSRKLKIVSGSVFRCQSQLRFHSIEKGTEVESRLVVTEREGFREEGKDEKIEEQEEKETDVWWLLLKKFSLYSLFRFKFLGFVSAFQIFTFSECYVNVKNLTVTAEDAIKRGIPVLHGWVLTLFYQRFRRSHV